ncbi:MAG: DUF6443 domain-containing protein, partial [Bacteroidota bacterium]
MKVPAPTLGAGIGNGNGDGDEMAKVLVFHGQGATLTVEGSTGTYEWYTADVAAGTSPVHTGNTFTTTAITQPTLYYVAARHANGYLSDLVAIEIVDVPAPVIEEIVEAVDARLLLRTQVYDTYLWKKNDTQERATTSQVSISVGETGSFRVEVTKAGIQGVGVSDPVNIAASNFRGSRSHHYVTINTPLKKGVKTELDIANLPTEDLHQVTTYLDNALRPVQQVVTKGAPNGQDMVSFKQYDKLGREPKGYLPYIGGSGGIYQLEAATKQADFYQNTPNIAHTAHPYQQQHYDHSPLNVVRQNSVVGMDGDADVDTTPPPNVRIDPTTAPHRNEQTYYANNADNEVRLFIYDFDTGEIKAEGYYNTRQLMVQRVGKKQMGGLDEPVTTYTNKLGQTVLKKVPTGIETYYVYDDFGQGRMTIPPKGVAALESRGDNFTLEAA